MAPRNRRTGYNRIRFKCWNPSQAALVDHDGGLIQWKLDRNVLLQQSLGGNCRHCQAETPASGQLCSCLTPLQPLPKNGIRMDPFLKLPLEYDDCVLKTLDYYTIVCSYDRSNNILQDSSNPHMTLLLPFALQNAVLLESLVTVCRASILVSQCRSAIDDNEFLRYRGRTIRNLTLRLRSTSCVDDAAILSVANMLTVEYLVQSHNGVRTHLAGLKKMLELRDNDVDNDNLWDRFVREGLKSTQSLALLFLGQPPPVTSNLDNFVEETFAELSPNKRIAYPAIPLSKSITTILERLPEGFSKLCASGQISNQAIDILASFARVVTSEASTLSEIQRLSESIQIMLSALNRLHLRSINQTENVVVCGLVAYIFQLRSHKPIGTFQDPQLRSFIDIIPMYPKSESIHVQNTLIWVSMAATGALSRRAVSMPGAHKLLEYVFELYPYTSSHWSRIESVLRNFFWTEAIGAHWRVCWEVAMARKDIIERRGMKSGSGNPSPWAAIIGHHNGKSWKRNTKDHESYGLEDDREQKMSITQLADHERVSRRAIHGVVE